MNNITTPGCFLSESKISERSLEMKLIVPQIELQGWVKVLLDLLLKLCCLYDPWGVKKVPKQ